MLDIGTALRWYKKPEVQRAIVDSASHREIGVKYGERGFGTRPELLVFPKDVLEFAKKGATSFHCSEELWENPQLLKAATSQQQLNNLRIGWDLVIDIDCPIWEYSKRITMKVAELLKARSINSVSVKFSGNKGFHIGVPFSAFPKRFNRKPIALLFPEAPRKIANYISYLLEQEMLNELDNSDRKRIAKYLDKSEAEIFITVCADCHARAKSLKQKVEFICRHCGYYVVENKDKPYMICPRCNKIMDKQLLGTEFVCRHCGSKKPPIEIFDVNQLIKIDTVLIASRHLYRMPFSLHEKSGLVSLPIKVSQLNDFERESAAPERIIIGKQLKFLDDSKAEQTEGARLLLEAYDFDFKIGSVSSTGRSIEYKLPSQPVPSTYFPPCINGILNGLEDGRKRSLFILLNFLKNMSWSYEQIEAFILEWNKANKPPLKENLVRSYLYHFKKQKQVKLPPNCDKPGYYLDIGVCHPDKICKKIKNPVNYYWIKQKRLKKK